MYVECDTDRLYNQATPTTKTQQVVTPQLGKRHKLNYQKWVNILKQEAKVAAEKKPRDLSVLAGDSLSLWFPSELLPDNKTWLNQGISGEKTAGLLKRLNLFDKILMLHRTYSLL